MLLSLTDADRLDSLMAKAGAPKGRLTEGERDELRGILRRKYPAVPYTFSWTYNAVVSRANRQEA